MKISVFISYRRQGGIEIARNVYERLSLAGYNTFFDFDSIRDGMFNQQIYAAIEDSQDFLLILTKGSLDNCINENDWVKLEIEHALLHKKNIVLFARDDFEFPENLPDSIKSIKFINIVFLNNNYYNESIERLIKNLSNKKRKFSKWVIIAFMIALIAGVVILFLSNNFKSTSDIITPSECVATIYLMRYNDIDLKGGIKYSDKSLEVFQYQDSLDASESYYIYPTSRYYNWGKMGMTIVYQNNVDTIPLLEFHYPTIRLKLQSFQNKTLVLNKCVIEVDSVINDENINLRFLINKNILSIINDSWNYWDVSILRYSWLLDGESFNGFKTERKIPYFEDSLLINTEKDNAVVLFGEIEFLNGQKTKFYYNEKQKDTIHSPSESFNKNRETISEQKPTIIELQSTKQEIEIIDFNRSLVKGEIDDNFFFQFFFNGNCTSRIRLRLETIDGTGKVSYLYSNYIYNYYFLPRHIIQL